jgi:phosphoribosylformylglycinamidine synthase
MTDTTIDRKYTDLNYSKDKISTYLEQVQLEAVACKDWLTNKVDRCVGGKVAKQQTTGPLQCR